MLYTENIDYPTLRGVRSLFNVNYDSAGKPLDIYSLQKNITPRLTQCVRATCGTAPVELLVLSE